MNILSDVSVSVFVSAGAQHHQQAEPQPGPTSSGQGPQGTSLSMFKLPAKTMSEVAAASGAPGHTIVRFSTDPEAAPLPGTALPPHCRHLEKEAAYVCKKCHLAFPSEAAVNGHQRSACFATCFEQRGCVRLVQLGFECRACAERVPTVVQLREHCASAQHVAATAAAEQPSAELTHEMEDVVNQITALAAQATSGPAPLQAGPVSG